MNSRRLTFACACVMFNLICLGLKGHAAESLGKVNTATIHGGKVVTAKTDAKGTIHVLLDSPDGPRYAHSDDQGKSFSQAIPIVDRESKKPGLEFSGWDLAVSPAGQVHVAMSTNAWKLKRPREEWAYFYARLAPGGQTFSRVQNLNHKPSEGFSLAADGLGNVTACWLSDKLYANVSHDEGTTFAAAVEIDPSLNPCDCCTSSAAYGADGKLAILYREETNNDRDMFVVFWDQKNNKVSRSQVSTTSWKIDACPMTYYNISAQGNGFLAVWPTQGRVYFARLDKNGTVLPPAEVKTPGSNGMRSGMLALSDPQGNTLVAWKKNDLLGWQLYDQQGQPAGQPGSVSSAGKGAAGVLSKDGKFILIP